MNEKPKIERKEPISRPYKVLISSTYLDNKRRRKIVEDSIRLAGMIPIGMELLLAETHPTVEVCRRLARECDVMVGIIAHRYGWIPEGEEKSITEIEYTEARDRLMFLIDESVPIVIESDFDKGPDRWEKQKKLESFRLQIQKDQTPATPFVDDTLGGLVLASLQEWFRRREQIDIEKSILSSSATGENNIQKDLSFSGLKNLVLGKVLTSKEISMASMAENDCQILGIPLREPINFILKESARHPHMFSSKFSSIPFLFSENIILLSWDGSLASIERILSREEAYPLNDVWATCLSFYRQATLLPYRTKGPEQLILSSEARRALKHYRKLVKHTKDFLCALEKVQGLPEARFIEFEPLIDEAEFALTNEDISTCIARFEALLSMVHKLVLYYAPQGTIKTKAFKAESVNNEPLDKEVKSILLVEDDDIGRLLGTILENMGYELTIVKDGAGAVKALVNRDYDIIITDLVMPGIDGFEVASTARKSGSKAKILIISAYTEIKSLALNHYSNINIPYDCYLSKPFTAKEIKEIIQKLIG